MSRWHEHDDHDALPSVDSWTADKWDDEDEDTDLDDRLSLRRHGTTDGRAWLAEDDDE